MDFVAKWAPSFGRMNGRLNTREPIAQRGWMTQRRDWGLRLRSRG